VKVFFLVLEQPPNILSSVEADILFWLYPGLYAVGLELLARSKWCRGLAGVTTLNTYTPTAHVHAALGVFMSLGKTQQAGQGQKTPYLGLFRDKKS
jgi:hypothetical protein